MSNLNAATVVQASTSKAHSVSRCTKLSAWLDVLSCSHCIVDIVNFGNQSVFLAYSLDLIMVCKI